jgi:hypothetical protein
MNYAALIVVTGLAALTSWIHCVTPFQLMRHYALLPGSDAPIYGGFIWQMGFG